MQYFEQLFVLDRIESCADSLRSKVKQEVKQDQRNDVTIFHRTNDVIRDTGDSCFSTMVSPKGRLFNRKQFVLFCVV